MIREYIRVGESEFGGDELSFRREMRTRRVVDKQSIHGRVQDTGGYLISNY